MPRGKTFVAALACVTAFGCAPGESAQERSEERTGTAAAAPSTSATPTPRGTPDTDQDGASPQPMRDRLHPELARALDGRPRRARTPAQLAEQIVAAERAIADRRTPPRVLAAAGHLQQLAYRVLGSRHAWDREVRRALPRDLRPVVADNVASRRQFRSMHPHRRAELATKLPAWRIVRPAPRATLLASYREAERRFGVDWNYLAAVNLVETGMGRIRGTSSAGAKGPMQFLPSTWDSYGRGDINDPHDAILAAARFLRAHGFNRPGGKRRALYRYNNSPAYVRGVTLLAEQMARRPEAFRGYYHWQVYYLTRFGSVLLPEGYAERRPVPVRKWLSRHHG